MTNYVRFQVDPQIVIAIGARAKSPGDSFVGEEVELYLCDTHPGAETPYERLLGDAMEGDTLLFAREDGVEASWRVVDDVLTDHELAIPYREHTWGPEEQSLLLGGSDVWHDPVPAECPPELDVGGQRSAAGPGQQ
jgi:glucose-6-phosphate 1-dehydrogenase